VTQVLVLCYHAVSDNWDATLSVTRAAFRRQLEHLLAQGWVGTTFTQAVTDPPARRTLAVTFDDAYRSVRSQAAPVLAALGLPATVFAPTDWPGRGMRWPGIDHWAGTRFEHELTAMSWDDLRALAAAGWEVGSHTCSHPRLVDLDDRALDRELRESRAACERELGRPCRSVAYPFGAADARVRGAAAAAGYDAAAGLASAAFRAPSVMEWPRVGVWHGEPDWRFRLKVAPSTTRLRATRTVSALGDLRRRLPLPARL
jgi:peptidoglycan/xylan/chitin deacetylase (PgdA/CDA1 family)